MRISKRLARPLLALAAVLGATAADRPGSFAITARLPGADGHWDLLDVDPALRRLYMAREGGVSAIDLATGKVTKALVATKLSHGVAVIPGTRTVVTNDEPSNRLIWFDGPTGKVLGATTVGAEPDGLVYDPATRTVLSLNAHDLTIVDPGTRAVKGRVALPGEPEFGAVDGAGHLYDNIRDTHRIAVVDLRARRITRLIPLAGCEEPTGIAYDRASGLLVSVCGSGVAKVVAAASGAEVASIPVGEGADAVILDASRRLVFIPSGHSGTLSVISLADARRPRLVQVLPTRPGTRTGAVDPADGRVYLPSAAQKPPARLGGFPSPVPGTMAFLVVGKGA